MGCGGSKDEKKPKEATDNKSDKAKSAGDKKSKASSAKKSSTSSSPRSAKHQGQDYPEEDLATASAGEQAADGGAAADSPRSTGVTSSRASSQAAEEAVAARALDDEPVHTVVSDAAEEPHTASELDEAAEPHAHAADRAVPLSARRESTSVARVAVPGTPRKAVPESIYQRKMRRIEEAPEMDPESIPKSPRVVKPMPLRCRNTRISVAKQRRLQLLNHKDDPNEYKQLD